MKRVTTLNINGEDHEIAIDQGDTLLRVLRDEIGLLGPKRACDSGACGCCTVQLDGKAVYACMTYALSVGSRQVTTVEALSADGTLDPLQQAFIEAGAVQCGYCTSGMLMTAKQLIAEHDGSQPLDEDRIREAISGNLCRCTGYHKIVSAIQNAAASRGNARK